MAARIYRQIGRLNNEPGSAKEGTDPIDIFVGKAEFLNEFPRQLQEDESEITN